MLSQEEIRETLRQQMAQNNESGNSVDFSFSDAELDAIATKKLMSKIKLGDPYRKERKTERLIAALKNDVVKANLQNNSFFSHPDFKLLYLTAKQQRINTIRNTDQGRFTTQHGNLLNGRYIYIIKDNFEIVAKPYDEKTHHSYLANGKKVRGAGFMVFENGNLKIIDNDSGHYKPKLHEMMAFLYYLNEKVDYRILFKDYSNIAKHYISNYCLSELVASYKNNKENLLELETRSEREECLNLKCVNYQNIDERFDQIVEIEKMLRINLNYRLLTIPKPACPYTTVSARNLRGV